ncbi:uracil-DNA glycosylase, family 1 [Campylobacter pinnipediorum subsp. pinnipediorum]|uniref:uracil-DNA glycosylase n=1 Tax=Campylobacter pinnipediorum TaxID=1965231 RepID=UPI000995DE18|nr:uracil-DNA glycosylase [Campylobacter pinnipediorum]AQW82032.1 uracil-DNA glycosylase, family 1 [Campylobacter pinnipediorum subsp. pinnipediorum]
MHINLQDVKIEQGWKDSLKDEFLSPYFAKIKQSLIEAKKQNKVYPPSKLIFNAFNLTPFDNVKVVILGQDPYHRPNQAMGLSFSVPKGEKIPPSLVNVYKEIYDDLGIKQPSSGDLSKWAKQGVLLLNSTLSVNEGMPNSHSNFGWQIFTDAVIKKLSDTKDGLVFLLWGNYAKIKSNLIDKDRHLVLFAPHPSPLARGGFFGCKHFSKTNNYLIKQGKEPIDWSVE